MVELENIQEGIIPKYYRIKQLLIRDIENGKYLPNTRIPSILKLAQFYNVSHLTSSRAVQELLREGRINTIPGKGCFVSKPLQQSEARGIFHPENKRIVYISPHSAGDPHFNRLMKGIISAVQSKEYRLEIYDTDYDYGKEVEILRRCIEEPPAGIIFAPLYYNMNYRHLFQLQKMGVRIVLASGIIKGYELDYVGNEGYKAVKTGIKYLMEKGHDRIVFFGARKNSYDTEVKLTAYKQAMEESGIGFSGELVVDGSPDASDIGLSGYKGFVRLLSEKRKFTAVFTNCIENAVTAYRELCKRGIKVPEDISIIGFMDPSQTGFTEIDFTKIVEDVEYTGNLAARLVLKRIDDKLFKKPEIKDKTVSQSMYVKLKLIEGNSVKGLVKKKV